MSPPTFRHADQWAMPGPLGEPLTTLPVDLVFLHHTVMGTTDNAVADAQAVARVGISRFGRCSYSYLIHPNGDVFEAQGVHRGAHTEHYNAKALSICLMGNFDANPVPGRMTASACWALWALRKFGVVSRTPLVLPHRAVKATACPGGFSLTQVLPWLRAVAQDQNWSPS